MTRRRKEKGYVLMQKRSFGTAIYRIVTAVAAALATIAGAIAAPILCRPFYYMQIRTLLLMLGYYGD